VGGLTIQAEGGCEIEDNDVVKGGGAANDKSKAKEHVIHELKLDLSGSLLRDSSSGSSSSNWGSSCSIGGEKEREISISKMSKNANMDFFQVCTRGARGILLLRSKPLEVRPYIMHEPAVLHEGANDDEASKAAPEKRRIQHNGVHQRHPLHRRDQARLGLSRHHYSPLQTQKPPSFLLSSN